MREAPCMIAVVQVSLFIICMNVVLTAINKTGSFCNFEFSITKKMSQSGPLVSHLSLKKYIWLINYFILYQKQLQNLDADAYGKPLAETIPMWFFRPLQTS